MHHNKTIGIFILLVFSSLITLGQELRPSNRPNAAQQALINRGYGMFIHFGPNTFTDQEWSDGTTPVSKYNPTHLDPDQWVRTARDAGFRYVLLVTKHHDGFCLWDSKYTDYDVAASPVKTDVVKAVAAACKKYGLQFAIYYSLWDRHEPSYKDKDPQAYVKFMLNQLTELFTNYGPICELWLDGGWDRKPEDWNLEKIYKLVKQYNPMCAVSVNQTISYVPGKDSMVLPAHMTKDNQFFFRYFPSDFRLWDPMIASKFDRKQYLQNNQSYYLPFEHTICISKRWNWFEKSVSLPTRDLDELQELFYWCTDNNNSLVINVPPDQTGKIREYQANSIIELGKRLGLNKSKPLPKNGTFISLQKSATATSTYPDGKGHYAASAANDGSIDSRWASVDTLATLEINLNPADEFNKVVIFEYQDTKQLPGGFQQIRVSRIQQYAIDIWLQNQWQTIYLGDEPMGDCKVIGLPRRYKSEKIRLRVIRATAPPSIYEFSVINMP